MTILLLPTEIREALELVNSLDIEKELKLIAAQKKEEVKQ